MEGNFEMKMIKLCLFTFSNVAVNSLPTALCSYFHKEKDDKLK